MLELKKGIDILAEVGGIRTIGEANGLFEQRLDKENLAKLKRVRNEEVLVKIASAIAMCEPQSVFIVSGSPADVRHCRELSLRRGEEKPCLTR